jgi:hypothetical protein
MPVLSTRAHSGIVVRFTIQQNCIQELSFSEAATVLTEARRTIHRRYSTPQLNPSECIKYKAYRNKLEQ